MQPKLYRFEGFPAPRRAPREQSISAVGGGTPIVVGMESYAISQIDPLF